MNADSISLFSNSLGGEESEAIARVFASKWLGKGKECTALEAELAARLGADSFLLTNSGTAAIFLAVRALDLGPEDEVIVSSVNFVACASAVVASGATPVFADVDLRTLNITADEIARRMTDRTRAVILLHYGGHPCDMDPIKDVCGDRIAIIEDAAIAFPASYKGQACGTIGDFGVFSFDAMKSLAMGDGGGLTVRNLEARARVVADRYLGLSAGSKSGLETLRQGQPDRWWEFEVEQASGRHISNDILAAIGRAQLRKLDGFVARRRQVWASYTELLAQIPGLEVPPDPLPGCESAYFLYWVQVKDRRDALARHLVENGVYCSFRYHPLHKVPFYRSGANLPGAERAGEETLNIPLHQNVSDTDIDRIVDLISGFQRGRG